MSPRRQISRSEAEAMFSELLRLLISPLSPSLQEAIWDRYEESKSEDRDDEMQLLSELLRETPDDCENLPETWWLEPRCSRWWLCIALDWKDSGEISWQVEAVARTLHLSKRFDWKAKENQSSEVATGLSAAGHYFDHLGYRLLNVQTGGDDYLCVPVLADQAESAIQLLSQMGVQAEEIARGGTL